MKKLALLMVAILILGCGTDTSVVEEPPPVIEEPPPVKPISHPLIAHGTVTPGEVNVDPESLNRHGLRFEFTEEFLDYHVWFADQDGKDLNWDVSSAHGPANTDLLIIKRMRDDYFLKYDTEYEIVISVQKQDCNYTNIVIKFRTKPQRLVVGQPAPVIQERIPVVPSGERFRVQPPMPEIEFGDVFEGEWNVDPRPLNANGIEFIFNVPIRNYKIDLRTEDGASLGWLPRDLAELEGLVRAIKIMPAEGLSLMEFDTAYEINILIFDFWCLTSEFKIVFRTKRKP